MAKKIKFPLVLRDDQRVYTIEELREYFHLQKVYEYFSNGKLAEWLDDRYYEEEARQIRETDPREDGAMEKLCGILAVEHAGAALYEKYRLKSCTDEELKEFLENSCGDILDDAYHTSDPEYLGMLCSARFLDCLLKVAEERNIAERMRISMNRLAYDYLTGSMGQPDPEISSRLERLSRLANGETVSALLRIGLDEKLAVFMALGGFSSDSRFTNIRRVNFIICTYLGGKYRLDTGDPDGKRREEAEETASRIYGILFPDLKKLFRGVMLDVYDGDSPWKTEAVSAMYEATTAAVLGMVNAASPATVREILVSFREDYESVYGPRGYKMRMPLGKIPEHYTGIWDVLRKMGERKL